MQTEISAPDMGKLGSGAGGGRYECAILGSGPRGAPPLGRHHEQVILYKICSLGMYWTQPRPARPPQAPQQCNAMRCVLVSEEPEGDGEVMQL